MYDDTNSCLKDIDLLKFTTITTGEGGTCSLSDADLAQAAAQLNCDLAAIPNSVKNRVEKLFHCFVGSPAEQRQVAELGHLISFTGIATFKNAGIVRETVRS